MHRITFIILLFSATAVDAAWYQKTDGTIVDPIQDRWSNDHYYSGYNLEPNAGLMDVDLSGAFLMDADLSHAYLYKADLHNADLTSANLTNANLWGANLWGADLPYATLTNADLTNANMSHQANLWGADLTGATLTNADLRYAFLINATLTDVDLTSANLTNANLWGADLTNAYLGFADLSGSVLAYTQYYTDATWTNAFYDYRNQPTWASGMDAAWRSSAGILRTTPEPTTLLLALLGLALLPRRRRR